MAKPVNPGKPSTDEKVPEDSNSDEVLTSSVYRLFFQPIDDVLPAWTELKTKICILFPSSSISECINYWLLFTSYLICGMSLLPWSMTNPGRKISPSEVIMHLTEPSKLYILRCGPSSPSSMLRLRLSICSLLLVLRPVNHSTSGKDMESS